MTNLEAIQAILDEVVAAMRTNAPPQVLIGHYPTDLMAECLAARGVLAVDSLTDEQVRRLHVEADGSFAASDFEAEYRAALRRCATGEPQ